MKKESTKYEIRKNDQKSAPVAKAHRRMILLEQPRDYGCDSSNQKNGSAYFCGDTGTHPSKNSLKLFKGDQ
ncbi:hypothetical protein [Flavonifractor porci]|uniref:hypothetical protein n=1 Tax=Flavonifractor porci TaxID=3133422 RepID=UPI0030A0B240